ncbi:MAG TPA: PSD1 and planctomycete cytochrome C domain-containing protein, partial [Planctomycetaceae bacterium]|nr:PSD1 and planctomycete cytochrome C domain-containing protein [Planctomycetaceae bacterium]
MNVHRTWLLGGLLLVSAPLRADEPPSAAAIEFFESKIRPVLIAQCYECHSAESKSVKGGLRLDLREASRKGGETGPAVVPGDAAGSLLLAALRHESLQMPPERKLPDEVIADFAKWIAMGAPDPRDGEVTTPVSAIDWTKGREFWAFHPPQAQPLPTTSGQHVALNRLDHFINASLEQHGLTPNPPADRRALIRRLSFDLLGLPPSPEDVDAFIADDAPDAVAQLVDRLLASPQYGERWARLWLDLMRYAEDQAHVVGNDLSLCYPNAFKYRDWVIAALNDDLGYDEFLRQQLAADLLQPDQPEAHAALGFVGLGPKYYRRNAPEVMADEWEDRVDVVTRGVLGLTVACARCHDHKFDPISTADYYGLAGVFASTEMFNRPFDANAEVNDKGQAKKPEQSLHIIRDQNPRDLNVAVRGDVTKPGPVAPRKFLTVLSEEASPVWTNGSGRLDLAAALVDRRNPLTARVIVNRLWGWHFGEPLVSTASNFGALGERPSHPELLDDLAVRFMEQGWSLKWLHREIVLSAAYQRSSAAGADNVARDPGNRWLWRMSRQRLTVEQFRDALLSSAGRLDSAVGGASMDPHEPDARRRTVYSRVSRLELNALLARFDFPDPNVHSDGRTETTTPLQKLFVLNSPFMQRQAESLTD